MFTFLLIVTLAWEKATIKNINKNINKNGTISLEESVCKHVFFVLFVCVLFTLGTLLAPLALLNNSVDLVCSHVGLSREDTLSDR